MTRIAIIAAACFVVGSARADVAIPTHDEIVKWCHYQDQAPTCIGVAYTIEFNSERMSQLRDYGFKWTQIYDAAYEVDAPPCSETWLETVDPIPPGIYSATFTVKVQRPAKEAVVWTKADLVLLDAGESKTWACVQ